MGKHLLDEINYLPHPSPATKSSYAWLPLSLGKDRNTCLLDLRQCKTLRFCAFPAVNFRLELEFLCIKFGFIAATYTSAIQLTFTKNLQGIRHCSRKAQHTISSILAGALRRQVLSPPPRRDSWKEAQQVPNGGQELRQGSLAPETTS